MTQRGYREKYISEGFAFEFLKQERGGYKYHRIIDTKNEGRLNSENENLLWYIATACEGHHYGYRVESRSNDNNTIEICVYVD